MSTPTSITVDSGQAVAAINRATALLTDSTPLMRTISQVLENEVFANMAGRGRSFNWPDWSPGYAAWRAKRGATGPQSMMLVLNVRLRQSVAGSTSYGPDFATVGANTAYAAIHQFGGTINVPARTGQVRLREKASGALERQKGYPNLAVFAKDRNKRARTVAAVIQAHTIGIPARPYLPFSQETGGLQPETELSVLQAAEGALGNALK